MKSYWVQSRYTTQSQTKQESETERATMAEFALGLTKTAVEGTLSLVKSAAEEEKKLKEKVQNDLVFITGEFEMMQSFLHVASKERAQNEVVLTWVRHLRTLAFDVEDCVEYVVHLDIKSRWGWLQRVWHTLNCRAPLLPLDVAVAEIKQLKARVEDVSQRNTRYNLIHDSSNNNPVTVLPLAEQPNGTYPSSAFHILRDAWDATGKWRHNCNLQELVAREDDDLHVISVWGSTGVDNLGTTSIIRKAYCDKKICKKFKSRAWLKLMHPFNHDEFVKSLLVQFYVSSHQANAGVNFCTRMTAEVAEDNPMKGRLMQQMRDQRYLVVLEDVFTLQDWDVIRMYLPDSKNGSRIVMSTPQLGIALLCTGEPYQVSELTHLSDGQFLCAFSKKTRGDMGEFNWQLRRRGVISIWGAGDYKSILVDKLYKGIINQSKAFDGVEFEQHSWVDVPDPLNLKVFAHHLFLNFYSDDIRASEITEVGMMGETGLIQWCRECLFEEDCLVVINGLQSMNDWDLIKSTFLSKPTKCCILVITNDETIATHCVDPEYQALSVKDLEADISTVTLINKGSWYYGFGHKKDRLFYNRRRDALEWTNKFKNVGGNSDEEETDEEKYEETDAKVSSMVAESGIAVVSVKAFYRNEYYGNNGRRPLSERRSWVNVPHPFNLMDFSCRLLLDFYSDDPQAKEAVAVGLMEGQDPIHECLKFLRKERCLVVIDGLCSTQDWDSIKATFLLEPIKCTMAVITNDAKVALHCERDPEKGDANEYLSDEDLEMAMKQHYVPDVPHIIKEYNSLFLSERRKKATEWTEKFELIEREIEGLDLTKLVVGNQGVVSVWGIAGVGKSSLARSIYYNKMLQLDKAYRTSLGFHIGAGSSDKFKSFGWVNVPHPFNLTEFFWCLLLDFHSDDPQAKETMAVSMMEGQDPIQECSKFLHKEECLVVIDGLRSTQDWDLIKATFLAEPIRGTIVVITNEAKVALHCVEHDEKKRLNIRRLEADAALNILKNKIALEGEQLTRKEMLSQVIVNKCGGLPKVITAIDEVCSSNTRVLESLRDNFMGILEREPGFHGLRTLFSWMQSYFDACSDSIKPCIFYLSIFYAEKNIRLRRLLWRWIAEGYCRDTSGGTSEENGGKFVSELVDLSIIQQSPSKALFQINGFLHEYIISRPMEDNLVFALEGCCSLNSQRVGQHLTIRSNWDRDRIVYESIDFSRLRSLTVFGKWESFFISSNINMRLLRVLDLEDALGVTNDDLEQIGKLFPRLKFLSLRRCREITCLPSSLGGLRQLQTLDIRHTSIAMLPLVITRLKKLQYLRAGTTDVWDWDEGDVLPAEADIEDRASSPPQITNLPATAGTPTEGGTDSMGPVLLLPPPAGSSVSCSRPHTLVSSLLSKLCRHGLDNGGVEIGKLSALHTLGVLNVNGSCGKFIFKEIKKLTQLRKLGVSGINKGNIHEFCEAISGHAHLKSLSVELDKDDNLDDLDDIPQPPKALNSLKLHGQAHELLVWIEQLHNLEKLKLHLTVKPEELQALRLSKEDGEQAPLHHLRISPIGAGELHIGRQFCARVVEIQCSSVLHLKFDDISAWDTKTEVLKIHFSRGSSLQISRLCKLRGLKEVWLKGYSEEQKKYLRRQIDGMDPFEDQKIPVLKLVETKSS